jgi:D-glucosaminate-6-phosphate ammonia-lyase
MNMTEQQWPEVYRKLGVKPVINAQSWVTALGGSLMRPEIRRAMDEAATAFIDMKDLNRAAGEVVARACGADMGLVTAGCSAAEVLMAAACMTGLDEAKVEQLPDAKGMKNEIVLFKGQRNRYDGAFRIPGAQIVEFGHIDSARPYHLEAAFTDQTCAVAYVMGPYIRHGIGLEETIKIAHAHGVPVIVDAAAEIPPRENLTKFIKMGVDMVAFSGGKGLGGPQSAGLLAGRRDLMEAAYLNSLNLDSAKAGIGRPMKVSKENIVGMVAALELYMDTDEAAIIDGWRSKSSFIVRKLKGIPGLRVVIEDTPSDRQGPQPVIYFERDWEGPSADEVRQRLLDGDPSIRVGGGGGRNEINVVMVNVQDGEENIIAERLGEALS